MVDFIDLAQQCAPLVAPQTLAAIVKTESGFRPLAIGVNGGKQLVRQPASVEEAITTAKWLISNGYSIDIGLIQINSANLRKIGLTVEDAFNPCKNLAAGARILHANYQDARRQIIGEQASLEAAISAYNTGNFKDGLSNGYVQRVVRNAGFASLTIPTKTMPIALVDRKSPPSKAQPHAKIQADRAASIMQDDTESGNSWNVYRSRNKDVITSE